MTLKTCLRCDWHGETKDPTCPSCGELPLYMVDAPTSERAGVPVKNHPEESGPGAASAKSLLPSGTPPLPPDLTPSAAAAAEPSNPSARSAATFVLTALILTVTVGTWLNAHEERSALSASTDAAAQEIPASDGSLTPVVPPGSLVRIVPGADRAASGSYFLDLRTGTRTRLPESIAGGHDFAASSSGTELAYVGPGEEGSPQIFMAGIDGTRVRQKTHGSAGVSSPAMSPDGTMIAHLGKGGDLFVLDVATGESTRITGETGHWSQPQFTPDGSSVIYTGGSSSRSELRIVPVAGGNSTLLIGLDMGLMGSSGGSLSPDGSLLIFVGSGSVGSSHCGPCHLVANADGTEMRVFLPYCGWDPAGTWSPDGSQIVCSKGDGIIVVDIATGDISRVAEGSGAIWLDDHSLLVEV